jgi:hypothetical protein
MGTRKELTEAVGRRYGMAPRREKARILDEFVELTGYHRKHAIRVLLNAPGEPVPTMARNRVYDEAVRQVLIVLWEAADRLCGKRLKSKRPPILSITHNLQPVGRDIACQEWDSGIHVAWPGGRWRGDRSLARRETSATGPGPRPRRASGPARVGTGDGRCSSRS